MSIPDNPLIALIDEISKKFESTAKTLHNSAYGFWNTVTESLTSKSVEQTFDRNYAADHLKEAVGQKDDTNLVHAQLPFNLLGVLQQDYSRRYLSSRRHAMVCTGNQFNRLSRDIRYIYTSEMNSSTYEDNTAIDIIRSAAIDENGEV